MREARLCLEATQARAHLRRLCLTLTGTGDTLLAECGRPRDASAAPKKWPRGLWQWRSCKRDAAGEPLKKRAAPAEKVSRRASGACKATLCPADKVRRSFLDEEV
ncbi:hypothetical protein KTAU_32430 [Thermogemmatispora aurantia]|uniref:Uncharacterized protein n=1 Tax=Thermogemmatispora aurantia TaxID=2045279 RepID=A0A5J4KD63_9CHLR|nr:hypothetical protein KTAU_32430 [Thermogemmatispora aurantia]